MLAASPAPTSVCTSSMARMTLPFSFISSKTVFNLSSNSPRYLVPLIKRARSNCAAGHVGGRGGGMPPLLPKNADRKLPEGERQTIV